MKHKRILLIDDDEDDRLLFLDAIREIEQQLHCDVAENGLEALQFLHATAQFPHVIFLDINMPKMNGYELLKELKKESKFSETPIVIFTTSKIEMDRKLGSQPGYYFFSKPGDFAVLTSELKEILTQTIGPLSK